MFAKVLIANRGEVAIRINTTLERLGIEAVGVYTQRDRDSLHVQQIARSLVLHDSDQTGYLDGAQIIAAAKTSGAEAIHPGYGFLAESADFAAACEDAGLIFIGPSARAIAAMGEKISARAFAEQAGVAVVPGVSAPNMTNADLLEACRDLQFPLLVKPAAGGGGKGLHIAHNFAELGDVLPTARREAKAAFGDDTLFVEKYLLRARHIEFQVVADYFGKSLHLGERECSLQRRHQKVVEEAPSTLLTAEQRTSMGAAALQLTSAIDYKNLGTIEFLVDADSPDIFYFMEMNTRLQVEHRVTEMITGLDLVECQLRLAAGERLEAVIPSVRLNGHAIEARIYAEDPQQQFLPTGGVMGRFKAPNSPHTITDTAISDGAIITSSFDPMLAKISSWGPDRATALVRLPEALSQTVLLGVTTNIDFLIHLLESSPVQQSDYDTAFLEKFQIEKIVPSAVVLKAFSSVATSTSAKGPWSADGWRLAGMPNATVSGYIDGERYDIPLVSDPDFAVDYYRNDAEFWIHHPSFGTWLIKKSDDRRRIGDKHSNEIMSPMPGVVVAVHASIGDQVSIGDPLVVIEAMKMEHIVRAKHAGQVTQCMVAVGANVRAGQFLIEVFDNV